jgi:hypothetical protein
MPIDTICPGCQAQLRIGDEFAGQHARCPACDTIYTVVAPPVAKFASPPEKQGAEAAESMPLDSSSSAPSPAVVSDNSAPGESTATPNAAVELAELPPADGTRWYLRTPEGPLYGPVDETTFRRWVSEGRVTPDCFVSPGDNAWHAACEVFPALSTPRAPQATLQRETVDAYIVPHRGALILILGIMGIITTCPIPSLMAWVMGTHDFEEMQVGRMDAGGLGLTQAGRILGMVFSILYIVGVVCAMLFLVLVSAR